MGNEAGINWSLIITWILTVGGTVGIIGTALYLLRVQDYKALNLQMQELNKNKPMQDLFEKALTGAVSVEVLQQAQQGYQAITNQLIAMMATQQDLVKAITESQKFIGAITDGQPNIIPTGAGASGTLPGAYVLKDAHGNTVTGLTLRSQGQPMPLYQTNLTSGQSQEKSDTPPIEPGAVG